MIYIYIQCISYIIKDTHKTHIKPKEALLCQRLMSSIQKALVFEVYCINLLSKLNEQFNQFSDTAQYAVLAEPFRTVPSYA